MLGDLLYMRTESNLLLNVFPAASRISHNKTYGAFSFYCSCYSIFFAKLAEQILSHLFVFSRQLQKFLKCTTRKNAFRFDNI